MIETTAPDQHNLSIRQLFDEIQQLPPATPQIIEQAREDARRKIFSLLRQPIYEAYVNRAGQEPTPPAAGSGWGFLANLRRHLNPFDWLIPFFFVALLLVSLTHMLSFTGQLASVIYESRPESFEGIWLDLMTHTVVHQIMLYAVSELGILFLFSRWRLLRYLGHRDMMTNMNLVFALMCAGIVIYANVRSMIHPLLVGGSTSFTIVDFLVSAAIGVIVPALTMYLGERPAELIFTAMQEQNQAKREYQNQLTEYNRRRETAIQKYQQDSDAYNEMMLSPETHPSYQAIFANALVTRFKQMNSNVIAEFAWTPAHEEMVAAREIARLESVEGLRHKIAFFTSMFQPTNSNNNNNNSLSSGQTLDQSVKVSRLTQDLPIPETSPLPDPSLQK